MRPTTSRRFCWTPWWSESTILSLRWPCVDLCQWRSEMDRAWGEGILQLPGELAEDHDALNPPFCPWKDLGIHHFVLEMTLFWPFSVEEWNGQSLGRMRPTTSRRICWRPWCRWRTPSSTWPSAPTGTASLSVTVEPWMLRPVSYA